ncbi:cytochrome c3 family protein [Vibrio breoganii]|uniref:cytochrome c3 family protein n=1 Tax=Vibrio breoganii TaxID=553239 RepID=UPI0010BDB0FC|nr:cytochrome c3 family protein [Vibrio breoganii]TKG17023.1 deca-heme c-type cytochrome [Vibrio breoganii]
MPRLFHYFTLLFFYLLTVAEVSANKYVGSVECQSCHEAEYQQWQSSQHFDAMAHANSDTVKGNFDNQQVVFEGETYHFTTENGAFWVTLKDAEQQFKKYKISYTFAIYPLQQYMVEFDDGRIQLIPFAWDTRSLAEGGQGWFHLYPQFTKSSDDFFWLNHGQNWNYMCADCHSTNLQKGYDPKSDTYQTTWSEINVGCEACHGPASEHAKKPEVKTSFDVINRDPNNDPVCAQCHSRRIQLNEASYHQQFSQRHKLNLISPDLYYPDGQIFDEDYVYGSFLQSKMQQSGVICSDCHNPHTAKIKMPEPQLCQQCHSAEQYNTQKHAPHPVGEATDKCSSCHMVEQNYMQVDWRKDHSFKVPRPDLSDKTGAPNACTNCHEDKSNAWASKQVKTWFKDSNRYSSTDFSEAFAQAEQGKVNTNQGLAEVALDEKQAPIIRASALTRMQYFADEFSAEAIQKLLTHSNQYIRQGVLDAMKPLSANAQKPLLISLLKDPSLLIRTEAAASLAYLDATEIANNALLKDVLDEYLAVQEYLSDRGANRANIGDIDWLKGDFENAEKHYQQAIKIEPNYVPGYLKLNELYRGQRNTKQSAQILSAGLKYQSKNESLLYQYGLANIRLQKIDVAIKSFETLLSVQPNNPQYHYVTGLTYESVDLTKAIEHINSAYQLDQNPQYIEAYCAILQRNQQPVPKLCL